LVPMAIFAGVFNDQDSDGCSEDSRDGGGSSARAFCVPGSFAFGFGLFGGLLAHASIFQAGRRGFLSLARRLRMGQDLFHRLSSEEKTPGKPNVCSDRPPVPGDESRSNLPCSYTPILMRGAGPSVLRPPACTS